MKIAMLLNKSNQKKTLNENNRAASAEGGACLE